ncbi:MAG: efflux transporter outer membrane subunit [Chlamydiae bacterium]|nr:efflux transporter outer membrane subunit [Chlamydiota bacterium]
MKYLSKVVAAILVVGLVGCTLYPKYTRPQIVTPASWRFFTEEGLASANLGWWQLLGDPILNGYIEEALAKNPDIRTAMYRVDEYVARLGIVKSELYPQLSGQAEGGRGKISTTLQPVTPGIASISDAYLLLLNASFELDIWGKIRSAAADAKAKLLAQIQNRRTVILTLVSAVASSYINLRRLDQQLYIARETYALRKEAYYLASIRYDLGLTSRLQVDQAQSEVESVQVQVERFELEVRLTEDLLAILLGRPPCDLQRGKALTELAMPAKVPVFSPADLLNQRPDILSTEQMLIAANANIGVARARFFPDISLVALVGTESSVFSMLFDKPSSVWQYGANLLQEIFTGGRLTSGLKLAKAEKMQMLYEYESTILKAFKEVNDALISHQKTLEIALVQKERVMTTSDYLHLSTLRYNEGQIDYLTFMDAERQLFNAQIEALAAIGDSFDALISIYKSLGGGWAVQVDQEALKDAGR